MKTKQITISRICVLLLASFILACGGQSVSPKSNPALAALGLAGLPGVAPSPPGESGSHTEVTGSHAADVFLTLTGGGYIKIENNGGHVAAVVSGAGSGRALSTS